MQKGSVKRAAAAYLLAQGGLTIAWWAWMLARPADQTLFFASGSTPEVIRLFAISDLLILVPASLWAGAALLTKHRLARPVAWITAGAACYAFLASIAVNWPLFSVPLADVAMSLLAAGSIWAACVAGREDEG
jgi:hypothetical protein